MKRVIAIPDLHLPFHSADALKRLYESIQDVEPDVVIQLGDLFDLYSMSRFPIDRNIITPKDELLEARNAAENFWKHVESVTPNKCRLIQLRGNHDARIYRSVLNKAPEVLHLLDDNKLFRFKNVETAKSDRDHVEIDGVIYCHGFLYRPGAHLQHFNKPVVFGHLHRGWTLFTGRYDKTIWEMCCGHLADTEHSALAYTPSKVTNWQRGFGLVDGGGPRFVPL